MKFDHKKALIAGSLAICIGAVLSLTLLRRSGALSQVDEVFGAIILILLPMALFVGLLYIYIYYGFGPQEGIYRSNPGTNMVAITFDDGPSPVYTPLILDILKAKKVKATFFLVGKHVEKHPEIVRRMVAEGHQIGNHTYSHRDLAPAPRRLVILEVLKCQRAIQQATGLKTDLFRPPRGIYTNAVRELLVERGFKIVLWNLSTIDWRGLPAEKIIKRIKKHVKPGTTILFHDSGAIFKPEGASRQNVIDALPQVIDDLKAEGYDIVPVSELNNIESYFDEFRPADQLETDGLSTGDRAIQV